MEKTWDTILKWAAAVGGAIAAAFGGWTTQLSVLVYIMMADYVSGLIVAWMGKSPKSANGGPDSKVGFKGIGKKLLVLGLVFVSAQIDTAMGAGTFVIRDAAIWFYLANEGLSILENMALAGVPFPKKIKELLSKVKQEEGEPPDAQA